MCPQLLRLIKLLQAHCFLFVPLHRNCLFLLFLKKANTIYIRIRIIVFGILIHAPYYFFNTAAIIDFGIFVKIYRICICTTFFIINATSIVFIGIFVEVFGTFISATINNWWFFFIYYWCTCAWWTKSSVITNRPTIFVTTSYSAMMWATSPLGFCGFYIKNIATKTNLLNILLHYSYL